MLRDLIKIKKFLKVNSFFALFSIGSIFFIDYLLKLGIPIISNKILIFMMFAFAFQLITAAASVLFFMIIIILE